MAFQRFHVQFHSYRKVTWLNMPSNDDKKDKGTITASAWVMNHMLRPEGTETVLDETDEESQKFKQCSLTP